MLDVLMIRIFPLIMLGLLLVCAWLGGTFVVDLNTSSGPIAVFGWGLLVTAVSYVIGYFLAYMYFDLTRSGGIKRAAMTIGALIAIGAFSQPGAMLVYGHQKAVYLREMSPKIKAFATEYFNELDPLHSGTVTDTDLELALKNPRFNAEQLKLIELMRDQISEVGHVTGSYTSTTYVWIGTGNGGGFLSPVTTTSYSYGVSLRDLVGYPDRVTEKYSQW